MASTFYKYADRDTSNQVNWAEVGAGISEDLRKQALEREAQKALIDQQTRVFTNQLENNPMGDQSELNDWSMRYADSATKMMLIQEQLLKSGLLDFKDYTIQRQNLIDGTNQAYGVINGLNAEFNAVQEGIKAGTTSASSLEFINSVDGFRNFTASELVINPTNYKVMVGNKKFDPSTNSYSTELEDGFTTVNALNNRLRKKIDRYYVENDLIRISENMGELSMDIRNRAKAGRTGDITTYSGIADGYQQEDWYKSMSDSQKSAYDGQVESFLKAEDSQLEALIQNPDHVTSFLYDDLGTTLDGTPYRIVFDDKNQIGEEIIHVTTNPQGQPEFEFTDDQKNRVKETMRTRLRGMYDKKKEIKPYTENISYAPQRSFDQGAAGYQQQKAMTTQAYDKFGMIRSGTPAEIEEGISWLSTSLQSQGKPVKSIERNNYGVVVRYQDGTQSSVTFTDSNTGFSTSFLPLVGLSDMPDAVAASQWSTGKNNNPTNTGFVKTYTYGTPTVPGGMPGGFLNINTGNY